MARHLDFELLIITDGRESLVERLDRALIDDARDRVAVLLREPDRKAGELFALATALRALTRERGVRLLISDRVDVALATNADGVQLPEAGLLPPIARSLLGPTALIGVSRHTRDGLVRATKEGADYATLSPIHAVEGKAPALGPHGFERAIEDLTLPVFALGGVRIEDVPSLVRRGARGVAVIREVFAADDPGTRVQQLLTALSRS